MLPLMTNISTAIAILASFTIYFVGKKYDYLKLFPIYLVIIAVIQAIGILLSGKSISNTLLYNFITPLECCFYFYMFYLIFRSPAVKKLLLFISFGFALFCGINMLFIQGINMFNTISYAVGSLLIVSACIYYFFQLFQHTGAGSPAREPAFWISSGLLFFYACTFPLLGLINFLQTAPIVIRNNFGTILFLLNIFLYSSFTIAFLCRIKVRNSMS